MCSQITHRLFTRCSTRTQATRRAAPRNQRAARRHPQHKATKTTPAQAAHVYRAPKPINTGHTVYSARVIPIATSSLTAAALPKAGMSRKSSPLRDCCSLLYRKVAVTCRPSWFDTDLPCQHAQLQCMQVAADQGRPAWERVRSRGKAGKQNSVSYPVTSGGQAHVHPPRSSVEEQCAKIMSGEA